MPFVIVVADFQQLQPVVSGGMCRTMCESLKQQVELKTVYRSRDEEHLLFLNRIRERQPTRATLKEYFGERHWAKYSLDECVAYGMQLQEESKEPFAWLTCTNRGAAEVSSAALRVKGVSKEELDKGYLCDPTTKSDLRILARPGILIRLSRNFDKQRGFVNGAYAVSLGRPHVEVAVGLVGC